MEGGVEGDGVRPFNNFWQRHAGLRGGRTLEIENEDDDENI